MLTNETTTKAAPSRWRATPFTLGLVFLGCASASAQMTVESFTSAPTPNEIGSFKSYILTVAPGTNGNLNPQNEWAQHNSGQRTKAMGLIYEMTHDLAILNRMIAFCDAVLSQRNDLAASPVGQYVVWTGRVDPVWPNSTASPIGTGGEQGDPVGHLGYCARLVLETPSIWNTNVGVGDPNGYGATYLARAKTFVAAADYSMDHHILSNLLDLSHQNRLYWQADNPYMSGAVPWNQVMMFTYAFQNLAAAHRVLNDDPVRASEYDAIVKANMDWFFSGESGCADPYPDSQGNLAYLWAYRVPSGVEDWSHGNLDVQGLYRAYLSGKYGITSAQMAPLANVLYDVVRRGPNDYAGRVNGTDGSGNSAPTTYVRPGWYVTTLFRSDIYNDIVTDDLTVGGTTTDITRFSYFLWVKYKRSATANLALNRPAGASSTWSSSYGAAKAVDGTTTTRWSAASGQTANQWLAVDLGAGTACGRVVVKETSYPRITSYLLQSSTDGASYSAIPGTSGTSIGAAKTITFSPVVTRYLRLFIQTASGVPTINEMEAYSN